MKKYLKLIGEQRGFTMVELLIAIVVSSILAGGIVTTTFQIYNENNRATRNMQVIQNVENAGFWLNRDVIVAQRVISTSSFPLIMEWQDCDLNESNNYQGNTYHVSYSLLNNTLQRSVTINNGTPTQTIVAENVNVDEEKTYYQFDAAQRLLIFTLTTQIGTTAETRIYQIKLRSDASL
jgi:prepilin-type N-terminal cleavage/methylation domain-containing protein